MGDWADEKAFELLQGTAGRKIEGRREALATALREIDAKAERRGMERCKEIATEREQEAEERARSDGHSQQQHDRFMARRIEARLLRLDIEGAIRAALGGGNE